MRTVPYRPEYGGVAEGQLAPQVITLDSSANHCALHAAMIRIMRPPLKLFSLTPDPCRACGDNERGRLHARDPSGRPSTRVIFGKP